jgi:2-polyprenyl-3-methyl-5-hydroxy-6-metoxy-1,4-benzoquinol methylase
LKQHSDNGKETLNEISKAHQFNYWMYETVRPFCRGKILEIGSGIGNLSSFFVRDNFQITLSDINEEYIKHLQEKFNDTGKHNIMPLDLGTCTFSKENAGILHKFDTVVFFNVLEHIENDHEAVENCKHLLRPGGTIVILVPAYQFLYCRLDRGLGHYRRYTAKQLFKLANATGLTIRKTFYFNALGIVAWFYAKIFRLDGVPGKEMRIYDKLVPFAKVIDRFLFQRTGLSVVAIVENKSA